VGQLRFQELSGLSMGTRVLRETMRTGGYEFGTSPRRI
jgi:hypothetical protein